MVFPPHPLLPPWFCVSRKETFNSWAWLHWCSKQKLSCKMLLLLDYSLSGVLYVSCNNMGSRALDANKGLSRTQCYITDSSMYLRCWLSNIPDFLLEFPQKCFHSRSNSIQICSQPLAQECDLHLWADQTLLIIKDFLQATCNLDWNSGIFNKIHHPLFLKLCVGQLNIFVLALVFQVQKCPTKKKI
jgi:hypothetical protein